MSYTGVQYRSAIEPTILGVDDFALVSDSIFVLTIALVVLFSDDFEAEFADALYTETVVYDRSVDETEVDISTIISLVGLATPGLGEDDGSDTIFSMFTSVLFDECDVIESIVTSPLLDVVVTLLDKRSLLAKPVDLVIWKIAYLSTTLLGVIRPTASSMIMGAAFGELGDLLSDQFSLPSAWLVQVSFASFIIGLSIIALKLLTGIIHTYIMWFFSAAVVEIFD